MHKVAVAHFEIIDAFSDLCDSDDRFVAGDSWCVAGDVARYFGEDFSLDAGDEFALANVASELL